MLETGKLDPPVRSNVREPTHYDPRDAKLDQQTSEIAALQAQVAQLVQQEASEPSPTILPVPPVETESPDPPAVTVAPPVTVDPGRTQIAPPAPPVQEPPALGLPAFPPDQVPSA